MAALRFTSRRRQRGFEAVPLANLFLGKLLTMAPLVGPRLTTMLSRH
jgi:hypothetical protein